MVVSTKESYKGQEAILLHDQGNTIDHFIIEEEDPYEAEEALSLCDLPMYGDSARWDDFSNFGQTSNLSSDDNNNNNNNDEFFEFFSEDFTASTRSTSTNKNIIFCGKLIPQKEHPPMETNNMKQQFSGNNIKKGVSQSTRKLDFSVGKVSVLKSSAKSRWYLFLFGMSKFPTEMELRNMKSRQSRRGPPAMTIVPSLKKDGEVVKGTSHRKVQKGKGFWGICRTLSCRSKTANAMVKASFGCIPNV